MNADKRERAKAGRNSATKKHNAQRERGRLELSFAFFVAIFLMPAPPLQPLSHPRLSAIIRG